MRAYRKIPVRYQGRAQVKVVALAQHAKAQAMKILAAFTGIGFMLLCLHKI